jgi:hypothetical protein
MEATLTRWTIHMTPSWHLDVMRRGERRRPMGGTAGRPHRLAVRQLPASHPIPDRDFQSKHDKIASIAQAGALYRESVMKIFLIIAAILWGLPFLTIGIVGIASAISPTYRKMLEKDLIGGD